MLEKLRKIKERFDILTEEIVKPEIIADNKEWKKLVKERSSIEDIANLFDELESATNQRKSAEEGLKTESDSEMITLKFFYYLKMKMTIKTLLLKLERVQVVMKLAYSEKN